MGRETLAGLAGISTRTLANMERGDHAPQEGKLRAILGALDIDPEEDPLVSTDLAALMVLLESLVKRLPPERRTEWVEQTITNLATRIRAVAENDTGDLTEDELRELAARARDLEQPGGERDEA